MEINKEGLPTPWPVAIIGGLISLGTAISFATGEKQEEVTVSKYFIKRQWDKLAKPVTKALQNRKVAKTLLVYSIFNCLLPLIGSWISLNKHGLSGFQYPELAYLSAFPFHIVLLKLMFNSFLKDIIDTSLTLTPAFGWFTFREAWKKMVRISLKTLGVLLLSATLVIPLNWQIVALGIYASLKNFIPSAQFIMYCTSVPVTSGNILVQCSALDNSYQCYLGNKNAWIIGLFVRALTLAGTIVLGVLTWAQQIKKLLSESQPNSAITEEPETIEGTEETIEIASTNQPQRKWTFFTYFDAEKQLSKNIYLAMKIFIASTTIFYVVSMGVIQYKGLDTTGLEGICDINSSLLSSKSGYLQEWYQQEIGNLKKLTLL